MNFNAVVITQIDGARVVFLYLLSASAIARVNKLTRTVELNKAVNATAYGAVAVMKLPQVSSIGRLLFNRPVDRSRSISTVDKDSPT